MVSSLTRKRVTITLTNLEPKHRIELCPSSYREDVLPLNYIGWSLQHRIELASSVYKTPILPLNYSGLEGRVGFAPTSPPYQGGALLYYAVYNVQLS